MTATTLIVVPVYNEAARLDSDAFLAFLAADATTTLCFVDDGSADRSLDVVEALRARAPDRVSSLRLPENRGKAEAVRYGIVRGLADGIEFVGFADADLSAPLDQVTALRSELVRYPAAWAAFGSRIKLLGRDIVRSERRHYLGRLFATCASIALSLPVYDTQCGLKLFRNVPDVRVAFSAPFATRWLFDVELLARLAGQAGPIIASRVREVPLERWHERGGSRLRLLDLIRAPLDLVRIRQRYLRKVR
jgi:dolichyl-phosphate beta-glucosyltransferase